MPGEWHHTDVETVEEPGAFTTDVGGLEPGTDYEVRALAAGSEESDIADLAPFTTAYEGDPRLLVFVADESRAQSYEFDCEGPIEFADPDEYDAPNEVSGGGNDAIERREGSGYRAIGLTGNGYGDAYRVYGPVTRIDMDAGLTAELDREAMAIDAIIDATGPDTQPDPEPEPEPEPGPTERIADLEDRVAALEDERDELRSTVTDYEARFVELRQAAIEGKQNVPFLDSLFDFILEHIPAELRDDA